MLIDKRCPNCGETIQFEDIMESMFCPFCGGMITNDLYDYQDTSSSNEPNLYISFNSTDPSVGMVTRIVSTGVKNTYINGQTLSFHLMQGSQMIVLKIGNRNYNRNIIIPPDNSPVRIYASYNGRAHISIDQPPVSGTTNQIQTNASWSNSSEGTIPQNSTDSQSTPSKKGTIGGIIAFVFLILMVKSCLFGGSSSSSQTTSEVTTTASKNVYYVMLNLECEENLLFNKYDLVVLFDDKEAGNITHGTSKTLTGHVTEGKHTIIIHESGNEGIYGKCDIDVNGPSAFSCKLYCTGSQVEIKELESHSLCKEISKNANDITNETSFTGTVDYPNVEDFEKAINSGATVTGKTVKFTVVAYKPNSALGLNVWGGEHLNFISETDPGVREGDVIVVRITGVRSWDDTSWIITYRIIDK